MDFSNRIVDRRTPHDWSHVDKFPLRALAKVPPAVAEHTIDVPDFRAYMDQGAEGACVGFGETWQLSTKKRDRFDAFWLYRECKKRDGIPDQDGTFLSTGYDVLRDTGHRRFVHNVEREPVVSWGVVANRWASSVDDIRGELADDNAGAFGINWYANFDRPVLVNGEYWIGLGDLGGIRGGHCICTYRASDRRQAVRLINSWGLGYPLVWMPYATVTRLLSEDGECGFITPR